MKQILFLFILLLTGLTNALAQNGKERVIQDISYINPNDSSSYRKERCKLDLYLPKSQKTFKTLVWFHGGGLTGGEKEIPNELKGKEFAIVAPNYRLYPRCKNPEYTEDAAAAVAWAAKHIAEYGGSPSEIYVGGHSAGGYLTLMLCLDKKYLKAYGIDADSIKGYFPVSGQCATHYTIPDVDDGDRKEQRHSYQLKRSCFTELYLDGAHAGVGGIDSWSGWAEALEPYQVKCEDRAFTFWLLPTETVGD